MLPSFSTETHGFFTFQVILAANSLPSLNDVVANELKILLAAAADMCPTFQ